MTATLLNDIRDKKHHVFRREIKEDWASFYSEKGFSPVQRMTDRFERLCALETPLFLPGEEICFTRTTGKAPDIFTEAEWEEIRSKHFIHELGYLSNLSPNYEDPIRKGLLALKDECGPYERRAIDAILDLSDRYAQEAARQGKEEIAKTLQRVPRYGAESFREALQFLRILNFALWLEGNYHNTLGRFDQYLFPYLKGDLDKGVLDRAGALELIKDFFLSLNKDSDLYPGVQQGDNGQSLVLGGQTPKGEDGFNLLSELCLEASAALKLIDPKINLRVSKKTPLWVYEKASELTKIGLGFPQYSNDDVVIEGLTKLGYSPEDAADYAAAACWEFIIPKVGADVANIGAMSYPKAVDVCLHRDLPDAKDFETFFDCVKKEIFAQCDEICGKVKDLWFIPSPFMNALMGRDISLGGKYNNFGIHGTGIATAVDSLEAIREHVFETGRISREELIEAVDSDFSLHSELLPLLRYETKKLGNDDPEVNALAQRLLDSFADALEGRVNCRGGCYRAGTGSAMYYLWHANEIGASPDGRRKGEAFGANFSVSLFARMNGPVSVIRSMALPNLKRAVNGGPLTLEFHSSVFTAPDSVTKVAMLVKAFIDRGGHQLQLNAVNTDALLDAQKHPEKYRDLVVRIWGWSAYFVELDREYQDHVIARQKYAV